MAKKVRNQYGVVSEVPDDYPEELMRQLELEEVREGEEDSEEGERKRRR